MGILNTSTTKHVIMFSAFTAERERVTILPDG